MKTVGIWAFYAGIAVALVVGVGAALGNLTAWEGAIYTALAVLGIVVGVINVTDAETQGFVVAAIGLTVGAGVIATVGGLLPGALGVVIAKAFTAFGTFVAGAVLYPALRAVYKISKD